MGKSNIENVIQGPVSSMSQLLDKPPQVSLKKLANTIPGPKDISDSMPKNLIPSNLGWCNFKAI